MLRAILLLASASQLSTVQPIDAAFGAGTEEQRVLDAIEAVFSGLASGDVTAIRARLRPTGTVTSMIERRDGSNRLASGGWNDYLDGVSPDAPMVAEKLIDPVVMIDGSIAMVWGRYTTSIGGELKHCGFDHFDLVRDNGVWKIQNITWTVRFTGCQPSERAPSPHDERLSARNDGDRYVQVNATVQAAPLVARSTSLTSSALTAKHYTGPVIDTHAHIRLTDADGLLPSHPKGTTALRALDDDAHVQRSALIVIARKSDMAATRAQNDAAIKAAATDPARFFAIASVHPADGAAAMAELERLAKLGVRVIKLHPNTQRFDVGDPGIAAVVAKCGELGLVVLFDSYSLTDSDELGKLMMLSVSHPKTRFIFAHMGFTHFRELVTLSETRKLGLGGNVWLDISAIASTYAGSPVQPELVWTLRKHGMERVLFGSDWPINTPVAAIAAVRALGLTAEEERLILHDNAQALLAPGQAL